MGPEHVYPSFSAPPPGNNVRALKGNSQSCQLRLVVIIIRLPCAMDSQRPVPHLCSRHSLTGHKGGMVSPQFVTAALTMPTHGEEETNVPPAPIPLQGLRSLHSHQQNLHILTQNRVQEEEEDEERER
ncbi:unnamed protein product [Pleuronectes platessa]|uniref:Uncharacterized protein n=1 Tax=Pleuronectes platessa TaxID=8262 RepID=A0A9N7TX00_PLEPL|nr:unnamed protein product [Pleuronectes platessa]